jgi:hypothetical protein
VGLRPTNDVLVQSDGLEAQRLVRSREYAAERSFGKSRVKQTFRVNSAEGITR